MNTELQDFEQFMKRREAAATAYINGDASLLGDIVTALSPATFFSPRGGYQQGADEVWSTYAHDAQSFEIGSTGNFEILHLGASDGIAYWVGLQRAAARLRGHANAVQFDLRVTEIFRHEGGEWKLIHRHADTFASKTEGSRE